MTTKAPVAGFLLLLGLGNPLEIAPALIFAALFVAVSLAASWARERFGATGVFGLAAIVGLTDIDPFVLSIASGGAVLLPGNTAAAAVLIAASSNNVLKAAYAAGFAGCKRAVAPAVGLILLALGGAATLGGWFARGRRQSDANRHTGSLA